MKANPQALRRARIEAGMTMHDLARSSGVSVQRISELEGTPPVGIRPPTAKRIADALGVEITDIADVEPVEAAS